MSSSEESGDDLSVQIDEEEFSDEEYSLIRRIFEESDDEEEFEGFPARLPENMAWNRSPFKNNLPAFSLNTGPAIQLPENGTPLDFFLLFFEQELFVDIVKFTNKNAELKQAKDWVPLTVEELKAFLAFQIISNNILVVPRDERYFFTAAKSELFHTPGLRRILSSRRRFFQIKQFIFFVDPDHERSEAERDDFLYKIRPVYTRIVARCFQNYNCHREISVDEAMIPFKGRLKIKVRMPQKPVKYGIKFYELCDSRNGYCKNIQIYAGADDRERSQVGKTGRIVLDLVRGLENANHHCYMDNYYTSPLLFILLKNMGMFATGTARVRTGYPKADLDAVRLTERGQCTWVSYENFMLALRWKDKKDIFLLSTIHSSPEEIPNPSSGSSDSSSEDERYVRRRFKQRDGTWKSKKVACPSVVKDYNKHMGGVDLCDQMTVLNKSKKQLRWYLRVFLKLVMISIHNAFILEGYTFDHQQQGKRKRDLLKFKEDLCINLIGDYPASHAKNDPKRRRVSYSIPERMSNVGSHLPVRIQGKHNDRCVVCLKRQSLWKQAHPDIAKQKDWRSKCPHKDHKSVFTCSKCGVHLCIGTEEDNHFVNWHTKQQYWL